MPVEGRVPDDVGGLPARPDVPERRGEVGGHVVEVLGHVGGEQRPVPAPVAGDQPSQCAQVVFDRCDDPVGGPVVEAGGGDAPGTADRDPIQLAGVTGLVQEPEPVHVRPQFPDVGHPVDVRRGGQQQVARDQAAGAQLTGVPVGDPAGPRQARPRSGQDLGGLGRETADDVGAVLLGALRRPERHALVVEGRVADGDGRPAERDAEQIQRGSRQIILVEHPAQALQGRQGAW